MGENHWEYVPRKPRHQAVRHQTSGIAAPQVAVERSAAEQPSLLDAELLDLSRDGIRLQVAAPLEEHESIVVRLQADQPEIDLALPCTVRWQSVESDGTWSVGCVSTRQVDWETLGELFLSGILTVQAASEGNVREEDE